MSLLEPAKATYLNVSILHNKSALVTWRDPHEAHAYIAGYKVEYWLVNAEREKAKNPAGVQHTWGLSKVPI